MEEVIRSLDYEAACADAILRAMALAGYIELAGAYGELLYLRLTPIGNRLAIEKKANRIGQSKVRATIAEVVAHARKINSDRIAFSA